MSLQPHVMSHYDIPDDTKKPKQEQSQEPSRALTNSSTKSEDLKRAWMNSEEAAVGSEGGAEKTKGRVSPVQVFEQVVPRPPQKSKGRTESVGSNASNSSSTSAGAKRKSQHRCATSQPSAPPMGECPKCDEKFYDTNYRRPYLIKTDDSTDTCKVRVVIPGLKKPSWFGFCGGNADVDVKFEEQSLVVTVDMYTSKSAMQKATKPQPPGTDLTTVKKPDKFLYRVKKLPDFIEPYQSTWKIKDNQVELSLRKMVPRSWVGDLDTTGLETADDAASLDEQYMG